MLRIKTTLSVLALAGAAVLCVATSTPPAEAISVDQVASVAGSDVKAAVKGSTYGSHSSFRYYSYHTYRHHRTCEFGWCPYRYSTYRFHPIRQHRTCEFGYCPTYYPIVRYYSYYSSRPYGQ